MKCMIGDFKKIAYTQSPSFIVRFGLHNRLKNHPICGILFKKQYFIPLRLEPIFSRHLAVVLQASPQHDHGTPDNEIE